MDDGFRSPQARDELQLRRCVLVSVGAVLTSLQLDGSVADVLDEGIDLDHCRRCLDLELGKTTGICERNGIVLVTSFDMHAIFEEKTR